jgi:hypothetical protein
VFSRGSAFPSAGRQPKGKEEVELQAAKLLLEGKPAEEVMAQNCATQV